MSEGVLASGQGREVPWYVAMFGSSHAGWTTHSLELWVLFPPCRGDSVERVPPTHKFQLFCRCTGTRYIRVDTANVHDGHNRRRWAHSSCVLQTKPAKRLQQRHHHQTPHADQDHVPPQAEKVLCPTQLHRRCEFLPHVYALKSSSCLNAFLVLNILFRAGGY